MTATPVTGLVIEAIRKMASFRIGVLALGVHHAVRLEVHDPALARHERDGAGELLLGDVAVHGLADALEAIGGETHVLGPAERYEGGGQEENDERENWRRDALHRLSF